MATEKPKRKPRKKLLSPQQVIQEFGPIVLQLRTDFDDQEKVLYECVDKDQRLEEFGKLVANAIAGLSDRLVAVENVTQILMEEYKKDNKRLEYLENADTEAALSEYKKKINQENSSN